MSKFVMPFLFAALSVSPLAGLSPGRKGRTASKPTLQHVTVTFRTISGKRLPDSDLVVGVYYGEDAFTESTAIAPGVEFSPGSESGPWEIHLRHHTVPGKGKDSALQKDYVVRGLDEGLVILGLEQARPTDWAFDARVTFSFSDKGTVSGDARACSFSAQGNAGGKQHLTPSKYGERVWSGNNVRNLQWDRWETVCAVRAAATASKGIGEPVKQSPGEAARPDEAGSVATDEERSKRTMADIRRVATAIEAYAVDHKRYPPARDLAELSRLLSPTYIQNVPADAWGTALRVFVSADGRQYRIVSAGANRSFEPDSLKIGAPVRGQAAVAGFEKDVIYQNGTFIQWPE